MSWEPEDIQNDDYLTWCYTRDEKHFWPDDLVTADAKLIVDVGCNAGLSTGLFAEAWPQAKVVGIEMDPEAAQRARNNVASFGDRVVIINQAVGFPERTQHAIFPRASAVNHLEGYYPDNTDFCRQFDVEVKTLDYALKLAGVEKKQIDFMKIDVEGSEWEIMFDGGKWPEKTKIIVVEIHTQRDRSEFEAQMINLGWAISYNHRGQTIGTR